MSTEWTLPTMQATRRLGEALGRRLQSGDVLALIGDLGAGKTALAQAIARGAGVAAPVSSPTFGIVHEYHGRVPLFHFDLYRLNGADELEQIGFYDYFERGGAVAVEWADRFLEALPPDRLTLQLRILEEGSPTRPSAAGWARPAGPTVDGQAAGASAERRAVTDPCSEDGDELPRLLRIDAEGRRHAALEDELAADPALQDLLLPDALSVNLK